MDGIQLEKLYVAIDAQTTEFNKQMTQVDSSINKMDKSIQKSTSGASKSFKRLGKMLATIFIGAEINNFLRRMTELSSKAAEFKQTTQTAMATLANSITPILETLVKWIAKAITWFSGLIYAVLYGEKAFEKYKESLSNTNKEQKTLAKTLSGFDELNTIAQDTESSDETISNLIDTEEYLKQGIKFWEDYGVAIQTTLGLIAAALAVIAINNTITLVGRLGESFMTFIALGGKGLGFFGTFYEAIATNVMAPLSELASGSGPLAKAAESMWAFFEGIGTKLGFAASSAAAPFTGLLVVVGAVVAAIAAIWYALDQLWKDTGPAGEAFRKTVEDVGKALSDTFKAISDLLYELLGPQSLLGKAIAIITTILLALVKVLAEGLTGAIRILLEVIKGDVSSITKVFSDFMKFLTDNFGKAWNNLWKNLGNGFIWIVNLIIQGINFLIKGFLDPINRLIKGWNSTLGGLVGKIPEIKISIPLVPYLAKGGSLDAGSLFVAGEAGAEMVGNYNGKTTVMPLENTSFVAAMKAAMVEGLTEAMGGQSGSVIINIDGMTLAKSVETNLNKLSLAKGGLDIAL